MNWCKCGNHGPAVYEKAFCYVCWLQMWHPAAFDKLRGPLTAQRVARHIRGPRKGQENTSGKCGGCGGSTGPIKVVAGDK